MSLKKTPIRAASIADILGSYHSKTPIPAQYKPFHEKLIARRSYLESSLSGNQRIDASGSGDDADRAAIEQATVLRTQQIQNISEELAAIEHALQKIRKGTYGVCEMTQVSIPVERLMENPTARTCRDLASIEQRDRQNYLLTRRMRAVEEDGVEPALNDVEDTAVPEDGKEVKPTNVEEEDDEISEKETKDEVHAVRNARLNLPDDDKDEDPDKDSELGLGVEEEDKKEPSNGVDI